MTIKEIERAYTELTERRANLESTAARYDREAAEAARRAEDAAAVGDVDEYKRHKGEHDDAEARAHVARSQLAHSAMIDREEVAKAWGKYAADYSKELNNKLAAYRKQREKLLASFWELIELQADALETRKKLGGFVGIEQAGAMSSGVDELAKFLPMEFIPLDDRSAPGTWLVRDVDARYFAAWAANDPTARGNDPRLEKINRVLRLHQI